MGSELFEKEINPRLVVEAFAQEMADRNGFNVDIIQDRPDLFQFQLSSTPDYNPDQQISLGKEETLSFYVDFIAALTKKYSGYTWRNAVVFGEHPSGAVAIFFDPSRLSKVK